MIMHSSQAHSLQGLSRFLGKWCTLLGIGDEVRPSNLFSLGTSPESSRSPGSRPKCSQIFRVGVGRTSYVMFKDVLQKLKFLSWVHFHMEDGQQQLLALQLRSCIPYTLVGFVVQLGRFWRRCTCLPMRVRTTPTMWNSWKRWRRELRTLGDWEDIFCWSMDFKHPYVNHP